MSSLRNIIITPLQRIPTPGGDVLHGIRSVDETYVGFGECYFSNINHGQIKGWKRHTKMTMNLIVPRGMVQFVFFEPGDLSGSNFRIETIGEGAYARLTVPPMIWFAFRGLNNPTSLVVNISNLLHDPLEVERKSLDDFSYDWS
jgi:dTDP-4-dehydrorhamnose 3,5-epimerase